MSLQALGVRRSLEHSQRLEQLKASGVQIRCLRAPRFRGGSPHLRGFCRSGRSCPCHSIPARNSEVRSGRRCNSANKHCGICERHETAPFDSESFQNRVQAEAQDVALAERLPIARAEDVSALAAANEAGKQLRHVGVEVNDAIGVLRLW